ncbi:MAG TPA: hypothetical protein V6D33_11950 [Cyanophyceae cyanobacterium]
MTTQTEKPSFIYPAYFYIVQRDASLGVWNFEKGAPFYNPTGKPVNYDEKERYFGLTKPQIAIELFRINGGKSGWYLVDMRSHKYYYCGESRDDAKEKLRSLIA